MDLVRLVCAGAGRRFGGVACEHYVRATGECELLQQSPMEAVFEKGRCNPHSIMKSAVKKNLARYEDLIYGREYLSSIIFMLSNRLKDVHLRKGHNLAVWIGYINRASYTEVIQFLQGEGLLAKKMCGHCIFLSELEPYVCRREHIQVMQDGVMQLRENPFYLKERKTTDKCQDGFQPHTFFSIDGDKNDDSEGSYNLPPTEKLEHATIETSEDRLEIEELQEILKRRAISTKHKNTRKIYKRQHNVFVNLYQYISEGYSVPKAMQLIASKIGRNVKTIERDIEEIRAFLNKELSYT
jgi:hypothetical protein